MEIRTTELKKVLLQRYISDKDGTVGAWYSCDKPMESQSPICYNLGRPSFNNHPDNPNTPENDSSCIPAGTYQLKWTFSPHLKKETFEIMNVPGREGIRIHSANVIDELEGCEAPCNFITFASPGGNIFHNGRYYKYFGNNSVIAVKKLESLLSKEGCEITIKDPTNLTDDNIKWFNTVIKSSSPNASKIYRNVGGA